MIITILSMNSIFDEYIKTKSNEGVILSVMDVDISYELTPQKLKEKNFPIEICKTEFNKENKLTILESIHTHNSGFFIYLSKNENRYDVKVLHQPKQLDEIILFLTNLNRNEKHRLRSIK